MGYESKIFVVRKTSIIEEEGRRYATILATLQETIEMIEKARDVDDVCAQWLLPLKAYLKELEYIYFDELTILHYGY